MISYFKLWRLLEKRGYQRKDIVRLAGISESTYRKLLASEAVRMDVLQALLSSNSSCCYVLAAIAIVILFVISVYNFVSILGVDRVTTKEYLTLLSCFFR